MPNLATVASSHNKKLLSKKQEPRSHPFLQLTPNSSNCPLSGECHKKAVIYKASITSSGTSKHYIWCIGTKFMARYCNHTHSFRYREKRNAAELSKAFWNAKDSGNEPVIKWSIAVRATAYHATSRCCNLCLTEKLAILLADSVLHSTRSELTKKCRHKNK